MAVNLNSQSWRVGLSRRRKGKAMQARHRPCNGTLNNKGVATSVSVGAMLNGGSGQLL